ncbi:glycosyltransferase [Fictibacillus halophilus]|uniref:glycosyltransferase n=1 Tax=Fictibacillus halophilus TaxID=1610490 RepID=UPI001CFA39AF|nr:glycosyltransferase [Fictibacillus halophilus]
MRIMFAISSQYFKNDEGVWTTTSYNNTMWGEYLENLSEIFVVAPIKKVTTLPKGCKKADRNGVKFIDSSDLKSFNPIRIIKLKKYLKQISKQVDGGILHSPCFESELVYSALKRYKKPYVVESRGEQSMHEGFLKARGVPFPKLIKSFFYKMHMKHLESAYGCIYVSKTLKERYTPKKEIKQVVISDLRLPDNFIKKARKWNSVSEPFKLINVGNLSAYKDQMTLVKAFSELVSNNTKKLELHIVGKGPLEGMLKSEVEKLGIRDKVIFHGFVPWGEELFSLYDSADLFVLSSLTEGMPRVVLEALARGLPVVSTEVSGSIEVLPKECLVPVGNYKKLSVAIEKLIDSPEMLNQLSLTGVELMQDYREEILKEKKMIYFNNFSDEIYRGAV